MKKTYFIDMIRAIVNARKRFLSILAITALGVTILTGIYAGCRDMYYSADQFYDKQNLFHIRILSTLGLTEEDVAVLQGVDGIELAEGSYSENVDTWVDDVKQKAEVRVLSSQGMNQPYILEGKLPSSTGEIAVTQKYLDRTNKNIGDSITIEEVKEEDESNSEDEGKNDSKDEVKNESEDDDDKIDLEFDDADIEIEEEEINNFLTTTFRITGVVIDPMDISNSEANFRSANVTEYTFFVTEEDVESDVFTCVYLTLDGMKDYDCFSQEYDDAIGLVVKGIEANIKEQREQARYDSIYGEAIDKIEDAQATINEKFEEADEKIADAWEEIKEGKEELFDGRKTLTKEERDAFREIADARAELEDGKITLAEEEKKLLDGEQELKDSILLLEEGDYKLADGRGQLEQGKKDAEAGFLAAEQELASKQAALSSSREGTETGLSQLKAVFGSKWPTREWNELMEASGTQAMALLLQNPNGELDAQAIAGATAQQQNQLIMAIMGSVSAGDAGNQDLTPYISSCIESAIGMGILTASQEMLDARRVQFEQQKEATMAVLADSEKTLHEGQIEINKNWEKVNSAKKDIEKGKIEIADAWQELYDGEAELEKEEAKAKNKIADAWKEIEDGEVELSDGEAELIENETEYLEKKEEANQKIKEAYDDLNDLDMTKWYLQDRNNLDSYSSMKNDMSSIESIGNAFPILFLVVAILISLTTMTRMIEEERGLLGTYKALGYGDGAIYLRYILYAFLACLAGGIVGDLLGFIALPKFLIFILQTLYIIPEIKLKFYPVYGFGGIILFMIGIVGATIKVCHSELKETPASLMRPKPPRKGSRVFLERIPFIWNRLKFLNKVTVRNLFRYKKRFFMTVFGIMGCTALVLAGFAIKDSVEALLPNQYEKVYQYDLMAVVKGEDNEELLDYLNQDKNIVEYTNIQIEQFKVMNEQGTFENVQLMVVPNQKSLETFIGLNNIKGNPVEINNNGILITQNAAEILKVGVGDEVWLENLDLEKYSSTVSQVVQNYIGNNIYMTQELYETMFTEFTPNSVLAHLSEDCTDQSAYAKDLLDKDIVLTTVSTAEVAEEFSSNFKMVNTVVYVIIAMAAGLAFAVLFTLSNTNISERIRELATTKVLGFYDREVHSYVNKETLILTAIGIGFGLPFGRFLSFLLTKALKMPSIYFASHVEPVSYLYAIVITFCFALIVNIITNRTLNKINMVEALKSVE